jgi:hypothetical protein
LPERFALVLLPVAFPETRTLGLAFAGPVAIPGRARLLAPVFFVILPDIVASHPKLWLISDLTVAQLQTEKRWNCQYSRSRSQTIISRGRRDEQRAAKQLNTPSAL